MRRLKIREITFKETDIELPVYFVSQSDGIRHEFIKWDGEICTKIVFDWGGVLIESSDTFCADKSDLRRLGTKEDFDEAFENALETVKNRL